MPSFEGLGYNRWLSDRSQAIGNRPDYFGAHRLFPLVSSPTKTGKYKVYSDASFLHDGTIDMEKAATALVKEGRVLGSDADFSTRRYAWSALVDLEDAASDAEVHRAREVAVKHVTDYLMLNREIAFTGSVLAGASSTLTTKVDVDATAADKWDATTGDPIEQLLDQKEVVKGLCGDSPNVAYLTGDAFVKLQTNANTRARLGGATASDMRSALVTKEWLAVQLGVDEVVILDAMKLDASGNPVRVLTKTAGLMVRDPNPGRLSNHCGSMFSHSFAGTDSFMIPIKLRQGGEMDEREAEKVIGYTSYQFKVVNPDAGCILYDLW